MTSSEVELMETITCRILESSTHPNDFFGSRINGNLRRLLFLPPGLGPNDFFGSRINGNTTVALLTLAGVSLPNDFFGSRINGNRRFSASTKTSRVPQ